MGCINSTPEDAPPKPPSPGDGTARIEADTPPKQQPLYAGNPDANAATSPAPSPVAQDASTTRRNNVRRERSNLSRRAEDEDSDWDQYSTGNFGEDPEQDVKATGGRAASFVEKATHKAMTAGAAMNYKETSILRIDKVKGCMFVNQYLVVKFLGRGACGKVFLCLNTHDLRLYAMKAVRKVDLESSQAQQQQQPGKKPPRNPMEDLKREIMIMKKMKHTNIVTLSEVIDDPSGSKLLLVMEYMDGGPVLTREALEKRERVTESLARQYFRDMIKALDYLHAHKVVHGDIKPENVLMAASGEVKLSDFGCSKVIATGNEYLERCNGTPAFLAPEMMKPNTRYRGRPTDVYALGACLYTLMFGRIPFSASNLYKLFQVVQNEPVRYPEDVPISDSLKNILGAMLIKNPRERIGLADMMKHPWVTMDGRFPIKGFRELNPGESNDVHDMLPDGLTFAECNPKPDLLFGLSRLGSHERTFNAGEIIMKQGDNGMYLLYIVAGTADILVKWAQAPKRRPSQLKPQDASQRASPKAAQSTDEFMDESETMSPITDPESRENRLKLLRASTKARDFIKKLQEAAAGEGNPTTRDLLIAQRGPGDLLGDMALFSKGGQRCATVRCSTPLVVRVILQDQLDKYIVQHPMAKFQIRENILKKASEITMVEALMKLANSHEVIAASLEHTSREAPSGTLPTALGSTSRPL